MKITINSFKRNTKVFYDFLRAILSILISGILLIMILNMFSRYVFGVSFSWVPEMARFLMAWSIFLGAGILVYNEEHIKVDILEKYLSGLPHKLLKLILILGSMVLYLFIVIYGISFVIKSQGQVASSMMFLPMNVVYLAIPISGIVMLIGSLLRIIALIVGFEE